MRSTLFLVLLAAGAAATGFFAYRHLVAPDPVARAPAPEAARNAPDFALPDLEGRMRMSDEWDGRVRVVNFWATWCPPCRKEIPLLKEIQSEYGMAELTSQAYTVNGRFHTPPWMHVMVRDVSDPFHYLPAGQVGALNIIDLANGHSCAFIETQDLGEVGDDGSFTVLGRLDNSEVRGCNLLV